MRQLKHSGETELERSGNRLAHPFPQAPRTHRRSGSIFGEPGSGQMPRSPGCPRLGALRVLGWWGPFLVGLCCWRECPGRCPSRAAGGGGAWPLAPRAPAQLPDGVLGLSSSWPLTGWCRLAGWPGHHSALIFQETSSPYLGPLGCWWAPRCPALSFPALQ